MAQPVSIIFNPDNGQYKINSVKIGDNEPIQIMPSLGDALRGDVDSVAVATAAIADNLKAQMVPVAPAGAEAVPDNSIMALDNSVPVLDSAGQAPAGAEAVPDNSVPVPDNSVQALDSAVPAPVPDQINAKVDGGKKTRRRGGARRLRRTNRRLRRQSKKQQHLSYQ
jgi:hypothetical protein